MKVTVVLKRLKYPHMGSEVRLTTEYRKVSESPQVSYEGITYAWTSTQMVSGECTIRFHECAGPLCLDWEDLA